MRKYKALLLTCLIVVTVSLLYTGCLKDRVRGVESYTIYMP